MQHLTPYHPKRIKPGEAIGRKRVGAACASLRNTHRTLDLRIRRERNQRAVGVCPARASGAATTSDELDQSHHAPATFRARRRHHVAWARHAATPFSFLFFYFRFSSDGPTAGDAVTSE
ncbi:hypothetical protein Zmor_012624 [Zophobas morio]|uniref:Uncharacterized protein n=1 Tax=Zophobas morio TaxID=2755281 RepID=A0AA38IBC0_9CUCU|nr:hypothetical protein Zmor_012624 [Zophobas morio]